MTAMKTFDNTRPLVGAMACGIGRAAYDYARDFVKDNYLLSRPLPRVLHVSGTTLGPDSWVASFLRAAVIESNQRNI